MKRQFHPVIDNPIRMAHVPAWDSVEDLTKRIEALQKGLGKGSVVPARWEPFHKECPCYRDASSYAWALESLNKEFPLAFAFYTGYTEPNTGSRARANWLILCARDEESQVTRRLMLTEALELWTTHEAEWSEEVTCKCDRLGISDSKADLLAKLRLTLKPMEEALATGSPSPGFALGEPRPETRHGFDKELLELDGWMPDPGSVTLPVDGLAHAVLKQVLMMDLHYVAFVTGGQPMRVVKWEKVTLVHTLDGAVVFEIAGEDPLVIRGYKDPDAAIEVIHKSYKAATERILQALASHVIRPGP